MTWRVAQLLLVAYGFCWVIGASKLTLGVRKWLDRSDAEGLSPAGWFLSLLECRGCLGFWVGVAYGIRIGAGPVVTGLTVLTTNLILEAIVSNIKE